MPMRLPNKSFAHDTLRMPSVRYVWSETVSNVSRVLTMDTFVIRHLQIDFIIGSTHPLNKNFISDIEHWKKTIA